MTSRAAATTAAATAAADAPADARQPWRGDAARLVPLLLTVAAMMVMLAWTWRRTPDPVIDFGRELYVPWRIVEGQVLYRDLHYFNGPLSPYVNAAVYGLLGVSLTSVKIANAAIAVAAAVALSWIVRRLAGAFAAAVAGVTFAAVFACGQLNYDANFNFLTPYSHDLTHGLALSLLMVLSLGAAVEKRSPWRVALAGGLLGLVALTKAEVLLAATVAAAAGWVALMWVWRPGLKQILRLVGAFAGAAVVPPLVAFVLLALAMPAGQALGGVLGTWQWAGDPRLLRISYFRWTLGIDDTWENFELMFVYAGAIGAVLLPACLLARLMRPKTNGAVAVTAILVGIVTLAVLGLSASQVRWSQLSRPLPLFVLAIGVALLIRMIRRGRKGEPGLPLALVFTALSGALLAKIILRASFYHYGFALAAPATMLLVAAVFGWVPLWVSGGTRAGWIVRAAMLAAWGVFLWVVLSANARWLAPRVHPVARGADAFLADDRGRIVNETLGRIKGLLAPGETLTVVPEGSMLNYLSRRVNPARYQNFLPAEMMLFDEDRMLAELVADPPDWIALVHNDTRVYDAPLFGVHYGRKIDEWIRQNYLPRAQVGAMPFTSEQFGILLVRRNPTR